MQAVPMPPIEKSPWVMARLPAPSVRATAAVMKFLLSVKSTLFSTQMRAPVVAIRPNRDYCHAAQDGLRDRQDEGPNIGEKPSRIATTAAITKTRLE